MGNAAVVAKPKRQGGKQTPQTLVDAFLRRTCARLQGRTDAPTRSSAGAYDPITSSAPDGPKREAGVRTHRDAIERIFFGGALSDWTARIRACARRFDALEAHAARHGHRRKLDGQRIGHHLSMPKAHAHTQAGL